jgi:NTP pyrophosphatase (non-canonical NTP hydrolase)
VDFQKLTAEAGEISRSKGWWDGYLQDFTLEDKMLYLASHVALMHSELSEASECLRDNQLDQYKGLSGKPEGFVVELGDAIIRIMQLCDNLDLDLEKAIVDKMAFNKTRQHRHDGRIF